MVTFLNKEHFTNHVDKVIVVSNESVKELTRLPPEDTPRGREVIGDVDHVTMVVENGHIHCAVSITVAHSKFVLKALHIHFIDWFDKGKCNHATQQNVEARLFQWLNLEAVDNSVGIFLLPHMEGYLALLRIGILGRAIQ